MYMKLQFVDARGLRKEAGGAAMGWASIWEALMHVVRDVEGAKWECWYNGLGLG